MKRNKILSLVLIISIIFTLSITYVNADSVIQIVKDAYKVKQQNGKQFMLIGTSTLAGNDTSTSIFIMNQGITADTNAFDIVQLDENNNLTDEVPNIDTTLYECSLEDLTYTGGIDLSSGAVALNRQYKNEPSGMTIIGDYPGVPKLNVTNELTRFYGFESWSNGAIQDAVDTFQYFPQNHVIVVKITNLNNNPVKITSGYTWYK